LPISEEKDEEGLGSDVTRMQLPGYSSPFDKAAPGVDLLRTVHPSSESLFTWYMPLTRKKLVKQRFFQATSVTYLSSINCPFLLLI
jgi:hypothetical protein